VSAYDKDPAAGAPDKAQINPRRQAGTHIRLVGKNRNPQQGGGGAGRHTDKAALGKEQMRLLFFEDTARREDSGNNLEYIGYGFKGKISPELSRRYAEKFQAVYTRTCPFDNGTIHAGI